ncbi:MAG TPA: rRNA pseudouridine synthase [Ramlibacter sp.]|nr:rRNA pseudouridine synthase [Ramlibacter sp.]
MAEEPVRLAKRVAALAACSRSEAEQLIDGGWVRVDGVVVTQPQHRVAGERVEIDPAARLQAPLPVTLLLHQPPGLSATQTLALLQPAHQASGDPSGIRPLPRHFKGLQELLALPAGATGLAVFSQDGRIVRKLTEDAALVEQEVVAQVMGQIAPDGLARLGHGLAWQGRPLPPVKVSWQNEDRLRFALKGVMPAQVGWMCAQVGLQLRGLKRLRVGRVPLAGLPAGQWRYLPDGLRF